MSEHTTTSGYLPTRPRDQRGPARDRIVAVATRLFYRHGIRAVGIDTVIEQAGVAKTTLYKHFRSKDELIAECLTRLDERYFQWFEAEVSRRASEPAAQLVAVFDVLDEWFQSTDFRGCAFINAAVELEREHPARRAITHHKRRSRQLFDRLLAQLDAAPAEELSDHLMLLMEGAIVTALVEEDWDAAQRARTAAIRTLAGASIVTPP